MRESEHALMRQSISLRVCVCMREHVHEAAHKLARLCSFSMLSGRLWSHDHQAAPTAAMNHYLTEPPLDRRREREREGGPATGRKGWRGIGVRCGGNYTLGQ